MYCIHVQIRNFLQSDVIYHKLWLLPWHAATIYMQFSLVALLALLGTHLITLYVYLVLYILERSTLIYTCKMLGAS